jgi:hypothetical protein
VHGGRGNGRSGALWEFPVPRLSMPDDTDILERLEREFQPDVILLQLKKE